MWTDGHRVGTIGEFEGLVVADAMVGDLVGVNEIENVNGIVEGLTEELIVVGTYVGLKEGDFERIVDGTAIGPHDGADVVGVVIGEMVGKREGIIVDGVVGAHEGLCVG